MTLEVEVERIAAIHPHHLIGKPRCSRRVRIYSQRIESKAFAMSNLNRSVGVLYENGEPYYALPRSYHVRSCS
jgi:aminopeptidase N